MKTLNFKKEVPGSAEEVIEKLTECLKAEGFGILTRIDFHTKIKEKLGKDIPPTVILGACNPQLAYEAFCANTDVTALLPCNAVVREVGAGRISVELALPSAMMEILGDRNLANMAKDADERLRRVVAHL